MFRYTILIIAFLFLQNANKWTPGQSINLHAEYINIDHLHNIYLVQQNKLLKYDQLGEKLCEYSINYSGSITSIDVSDPMRILLYYEDYNQLVFLDNKLAPIGSTVVLDDFNFGYTKVVCSSEQGGFWVYSLQKQQLFYINSNMQIEQKSVSIGSVLTINSVPNFIYEKNNKLYLNIPEEGIYVFDIYGYYIKKIPIKMLSNFQLNENNIIYPVKNKIVRFNQLQLNFDTTQVTELGRIEDIKIERNIAIVQYENKVQIFNYK